jgi:hypothetical protein
MVGSSRDRTGLSGKVSKTKSSYLSVGDFQEIGGFTGRAAVPDPP